MKTLVCLLATLGISFSTFAQKPPHAGSHPGKAPGGSGPTGAIVGIVNDQGDGSPLEYATVTVLKSLDSSMVTGGISNLEGRFFIEKVPLGTYIVKASFIGYNPIYKSGVEVKPGPPADLGTLSVQESSGNLEEMEVVAESELMETHIDKKVFRADKDLSSKSGTGLDVIRNVPSLSVNENNQIELRGDQSVTIFIDGRPSAIPAAQLLQQIPATSIEKVEIVTNPSAKYDPEGMAGIINIVMKKNQTKGFNGNLNTGLAYGKYLKNNFSLMLNYKSDKINLYSTIGTYVGPWWHGGDSYNSYIENDTTYLLTSQTMGRNAKNSYSFKVGADFFVNENNTLYLSGTSNLMKGVGYGEANYSNTLADETFNWSSSRITNATSPGMRYNVNGGWQTQFKKPGSTFDLDVNYDHNFSDEINDHEENFFDANGENTNQPALQHVEQQNKNEILLIRADYVLPITDSLKLEAGFHSTTRKNYDAIDSKSHDYTLGEMTPDTSINNAFNFDQQVYATYVTLGRQFGKLGIKAGVRGELTETYGKLEGDTTSYTNDYFKLFPSGHLSYQLNESNEFQLSYSKRINRPRLGQLNPFASWSSPYFLHIGNPELKAEFIDVYEMGYIKKWKKGSLNTTVYYRQINDMMRRFLVQNGSISTVSFVNLDNGQMGGLELFGSYRPSRAVSFNGSFNYWYSIIDDVETGTNNLPSSGWKSRAAMNLNMKGYRFQLQGSYSSGMIVTQGYILPRYGLNVSVMKSFWNHRGNLTLSVRDIFKTMNFSFESGSDYDLNFSTKHLWESRQVSVNFNYFFGKRIKGKQKRKQQNNDASDKNGMPDM